ncbi:hypothetical protein BTN33_08770 [Aeromonas veronii]|uniref:hypothetical protein n=1 Tax=Aeromonas veronii TaxID=654 RepID=UPI000946BD6E|nr:hypothetical protein [Aeromonas veronii]OLF59864.1 hypothetical protein BTN33_08770 [Aeromonas veronii]
MNQLVVSLVLILTPGIIATIICDKLTNHSKWDSFKFSLYSLTLGMASYALLQLVIYINNIIDYLIKPTPRFEWSNINIWTSALNGGGGIEAWEIFFAVILSLPIALFASWLVNFKAFNKIARKLGVSNKYGDENLYAYYLNSQEIDWVYVRDRENDFTYQGRIVSHSDKNDLQEIVLSEVSVYRYSDSAYCYDVPTMYISRERGKLIIEAIPTEFLGEKNDGK